jgi:hypothetical protein
MLHTRQQPQLPPSRRSTTSSTTQGDGALRDAEMTWSCKHRVHEENSARTLRDGASQSDAGVPPWSLSHVLTIGQPRLLASAPISRTWPKIIRPRPEKKYMEKKRRGTRTRTLAGWIRARNLNHWTMWWFSPLTQTLRGTLYLLTACPVAYGVVRAVRACASSREILGAARGHIHRLLFLQPRSATHKIPKLAPLPRPPQRGALGLPPPVARGSAGKRRAGILAADTASRRRTQTRSASQRSRSARALDARTQTVTANRRTEPPTLSGEGRHGRGSPSTKAFSIMVSK